MDFLNYFFCSSFLQYGVSCLTQQTGLLPLCIMCVFSDNVLMQLFKTVVIFFNLFCEHGVFHFVFYYYILDKSLWTFTSHVSASWDLDFRQIWWFQIWLWWWTQNCTEFWKRRSLVILPYFVLVYLVQTLALHRYQIMVVVCSRWCLLMHPVCVVAAVAPWSQLSKRPQRRLFNPSVDAFSLRHLNRNFLCLNVSTIFIAVGRRQISWVF